MELLSGEKTIIYDCTISSDTCIKFFRAPSSIKEKTNKMALGMTSGCDEEIPFSVVIVMANSLIE